MNRYYVYLFLVFTWQMVQGQQVTVAPATPEDVASLITNSTSSSSSALSDEDPLWEPPEVPLDTVSGIDVPQGSKNVNGPLAVHLIQKLAGFVRPFYDKWSRIKHLFGHSDQNNFGGGVNPQQQNGHHFLTGINGAVYGLAPLESHDYPFAYRTAGKNLEKGQKYN